MRYLLPTLTCFLALAATAHAGDLTPRVAHMRAIADATYPGATARCGYVRIVRAESLPTEARATPDLCLVELEDAVIHHPERRTMCAVIVHEWGHVDRTHSRAGYDPSTDHSPNPMSIMYGGHLAHTRVPGCNRIAWAERKLAALGRHVRHLRRAARRVRSSAHRSSVQRRVRSARRRAAQLRAVIGP